MAEKHQQQTPYFLGATWQWKSAFFIAHDACAWLSKTEMDGYELFSVTENWMKVLDSFLNDISQVLPRMVNCKKSVESLVTANRETTA